MGGSPGIRSEDLSRTNPMTQYAKPACVAAWAVIWCLFRGSLDEVIALSSKNQYLRRLGLTTISSYRIYIIIVNQGLDYNYTISTTMAAHIRKMVKFLTVSNVLISGVFDSNGVTLALRRVRARERAHNPISITIIMTPNTPTIIPPI